jgi:hypothetical protein
MCVHAYGDAPENGKTWWPTLYKYLPVLPIISSQVHTVHIDIVINAHVVHTVHTVFPVSSPIPRTTIKMFSRRNCVWVGIPIYISLKYKYTIPECVLCININLVKLFAACTDHINYPNPGLKRQGGRTIYKYMTHKNQVILNVWYTFFTWIKKKSVIKTRDLIHMHITYS